MSEPENNRIYIDTNVLFNWLFGTTATSVKPATEFINDVVNGRYVGIISYLTLNELLKIISNMMVDKGKTEPAQWKRKRDEALKKIFALNDKQVEIVSGNITDSTCNEKDLMFGTISDNAYTLMEKYPGTVKFDATKGKNKHKGISTVDSLHVELAKIFKCCKIASFDSDFAEVNSEIQQLVIKEVYRI